MRLESSSTPNLAATVILAGTTGSRLFPLTSIECPKHLLPVGGIPVLTRLLLVLQKQAVLPQTCIVALAANDVVTLPTLLQHGKIEMQSSGGPGKTSSQLVVVNGSWRVRLVHVPEDCAGSADALRFLKDESFLVSDEISEEGTNGSILVLPGDLLLEGDILSSCISSSNNSPPSACGMVFSDMGDEDEQGMPLKESAKLKKGGLGREPEQVEYIGFNKKTGRVLMKQSKIEVEEDDELTGATPKLNIHKAHLRLMAGGGGVTISTDWNDLHIYVMAPWVFMSLLELKANLHSLQKEVAPLLIARQFQGVAAAFGSKPDPEAVKQVVQNLSDKAERSDDDEAILYQVNASTLPRKSFSLRICTLGAYLYACRESVTRGLELPEGSTIKAKDNTLISANVAMGEKVTCKSSTIGKGSKLGNKCRLNNVVIMDDVTIGDNCVLQNSILGHGCSVGDNCNLNDCQVGPGAVVPSLTKEKGESFMK